MASLCFLLAVLLNATTDADQSFRVISKSECLSSGSHSFLSPSGAFKLEVKPTDDSHQVQFKPSTHCLYKLAIGGWDELWCRSFDYVLCQGFVLDDGTVAGIGYGQFRPTTSGRQRKELVSHFHVLILSQGGAELVNDKHKQRFRHPHFRPDPYAEAVFVEDVSRRFLVHVVLPTEGFKQTSAVWIYDIDVGKQQSEFRYDELCVFSGNDRCKICTVRAIQATPLLVLQAIGMRGSKSSDALFAVIDAGGKPIWTYFLEKDYMDLDRLSVGLSEPLGAQLNCDDLIRAPVIGGFESERMFWIRSLKTGVKQFFQVKKTPDGQWSVGLSAP